MGKRRTNIKTIICYTDKENKIWSWSALIPFDKIKNDKYFMEKVDLKYPIKEYTTKSHKVAKGKYQELLKSKNLMFQRNIIAKITRSKFNQYDLIRKSGITNMLDIKKVISLSKDLTEEEVLEVTKYYGKYRKEFLAQKVIKKKGEK